MGLTLRSFQLQADVATGGTTRGALVHFAESTMGPNVTSETPWIAYVSCDANETGASMEWDVFTLARDRGAVSAVCHHIISHFVTIALALLRSPASPNMKGSR